MKDAMKIRPNYGAKRRVRADGYVDLWRPGHPLARRDGYVMEHRIVAWEAGLLTTKSQQIHHRNGDRQDNRLTNLAVMAADEHALLHAEQRGSVRNQYGAWPVKPREQRASTIERHPVKSCPECGDTFRARSDAIYCSSNCRIRAFKHRAKTAG